jgi:CheY-like chemotaxis protein
VLVIDDNRDAAESIATLVLAMGGEAVAAFDGESGVAEAMRAQPQLVFVDIGMPGMDGYETCRRLRQALGTDVVLVALSGWGQEHDKAAATEAGFDAHLTKPADPAALVQLLAG